MKNKLRKELIEKRKNLSEKEVLEKSKHIEKRLFEMKEFRQASTVLFYVSYDNEVYTHDMIKECINNKKIVVPITEKKSRRLILSELISWDDLENGSYGILEPKKIIKTSIDDVDLIIVPGVGFDKQGNRLGHGKGYYDNLLNNSKALKVALAFEFQVVERIPVKKHDVAMDRIITEKRIIDCGKQ
jgi:5-formyltetrahydrofolate cyclo-ligase